jgi:hypothetical protein
MNPQTIQSIAKSLNTSTTDLIEGLDTLTIEQVLALQKALTARTAAILFGR